MPATIKPGPYRFEVGGPDRRGRPSYHWVNGYVVQFDDGTVSSCMRYREAQETAREANTRYFFIEVSDTFGGEANYSWVRRYKVRASTERGAISKVSRDAGYSFRGDGFRYDARGACVCAFVDDWDSDSHSKYLHVTEI